MPKRFPDIDWYCDKCGAYLNNQNNFDDNKYLWKCTECGFKSSISKDNILEEDTEAQVNLLYKNQKHYILNCSSVLDDLKLVLEK